MVESACHGNGVPAAKLAILDELCTRDQWEVLSIHTVNTGKCRNLIAITADGLRDIVPQFSLPRKRGARLFIMHVQVCRVVHGRLSEGARVYTNCP